MTAVAALPLTGLRVLTAWTPQPAVIAGCLGLGGSYATGVVRRRRRGEAWARGRTAAFLAGVALLAVMGLSFLAVYDDALFWVRAVQGVVLLLVAPLLLAVGAPLTLLRDALAPHPRAVLGRVRRGRVARALTLPPVVTLLLIVPPFVLYLTGLYLLTLRSAVVSGVVAVGLLGAGFVYVASRLQIDPTPRRTHHGLTLAIGAAEIVADGVLGLLLWLGPVVVAGHPGALVRDWGPDPRTDQVIGAGIWWIGGDLAGLPFLAAILARFTAEDAREARRVDAELDAAEDSPAPPDTDAADVADPDSPAPVRPPSRLWWEDDPRFADRFRR